MRMTENDGILYIHTSRYIYWDAAAYNGSVVKTKI